MLKQRSGLCETLFCHVENQLSQRKILPEDGYFFASQACGDLSAETILEAIEHFRLELRVNSADPGFDAVIIVMNVQRLREIAEVVADSVKMLLERVPFSGLTQFFGLSRPIHDAVDEETLLEIGGFTSRPPVFRLTVDVKKMGIRLVRVRNPLVSPPGVGVVDVRDKFGLAQMTTRKRLGAGKSRPMPGGQPMAKLSPSPCIKAREQAARD